MSRYALFVEPFAHILKKIVALHDFKMGRKSQSTDVYLRQCNCALIKLLIGPKIRPTKYSIVIGQNSLYKS